MSLEVNLLFEIGIIHTNPLDLSTPVDAPTIQWQVNLTDGAGADQADQVWHDRRSVANGSPDDIDFEGGLVNAFGVTLNPARVAVLAIRHVSGPGNLTIGNDGNALVLGFGAGSHTWTIRPGGWFIVTAPDSGGWGTTAGSADILQLASSSGTVVYDIIAVMKSA